MARARPPKAIAATVPMSGPSSCIRPGPIAPALSTAATTSAVAASSAADAAATSGCHHSSCSGRYLRAATMPMATTTTAVSTTRARNHGSIVDGTAPNTGMPGSGPSEASNGESVDPVPSCTGAPIIQEIDHTTAFGSSASCARNMTSAPRTVGDDASLMATIRSKCVNSVRAAAPDPSAISVTTMTTPVCRPARMGMAHSAGIVRRSVTTSTIRVR